MISPDMYEPIQDNIVIKGITSDFKVLPMVQITMQYKKFKGKVNLAVIDQLPIGISILLGNSLALEMLDSQEQTAELCYQVTTRAQAKRSKKLMIHQTCMQY